jgi:hypothetical protein
MLASGEAARTAQRRAQAGQSPDFMEKPSLLVGREWVMQAFMKQMDTPLPLVTELGFRTWPITTLKFLGL